MIKIENVVLPHEKQWETVIRGMRNPLNSWDKSDSEECRNIFCGDCDGECLPHTNGFIIGSNDLDLMKRLDKAGTEHRKFMRMITVYVDITAPLYWWKEFDTYKVGTVANSCSTMHKIAAKEFTLEDFSCEHLETISRLDEDGEEYKPYMLMKEMIKCLNACRKTFMETKNKTDWWQLIQLLPSSYNQKRTVMLNYEVLANMYHQRKKHKLDEWRTFCEWIKTLPCSELITGEENE
ncbi:hypothetical protein [Blautia hansenii]|uniref:Uncharacterized protein n=1 Tax=Blautia hansenii DSM 20583 TaxID=537007 RepID=C9L7Z8_BLAHA|nr:hypothetical protein [Blautia hansenii]ASM69704.1 hypothetical protein CGC63_09150 [Blautia hansenii DSM 20583]EEX21893.1 hypothetical protein BLAHAN_05521 [Blautia hansenii DSM 20583]UWO09451.1 hypothetical protein NQ538_09150 [Blautia hansenii DSM 20583]